MRCNASVSYLDMTAPQMKTLIGAMPILQMEEKHSLVLSERSDKKCLQVCAQDVNADVCGVYFYFLLLSGCLSNAGVLLQLRAITECPDSISACLGFAAYFTDVLMRSHSL